MTVSKFIAILSMAIVIVLCSIPCYANNMGAPSVQPSDDLKTNGPEIVDNPDGSRPSDVSIIPTGSENEELMNALQQIEDSESLYDLVAMLEIKAAMGIKVEGILNEDGLALLTAFGITMNGPCQVTLAGLNAGTFRHFAFIYRTDDSSWHILSEESVHVNDDGSVSLDLSSGGCYVMITSSELPTTYLH